jgi:hypothetical protein
VCWEETSKKEDESLWVVRVVPPDGRPGFSRPLPLSVEGSLSLPSSRFNPNYSFEAFFSLWMGDRRVWCGQCFQTLWMRIVGGCCLGELACLLTLRTYQSTVNGCSQTRPLCLDTVPASDRGHIGYQP